VPRARGRRLARVRRLDATRWRMPCNTAYLSLLLPRCVSAHLLSHVVQGVTSADVTALATPARAQLLPSFLHPSSSGLKAGYISRSACDARGAKAPWLVSGAADEARPCPGPPRSLARYLARVLWRRWTCRVPLGSPKRR
jgi:hypothetical protein